MKTLTMSILVISCLFLQSIKKNAQNSSVQIEITNITDNKAPIYVAFYKAGIKFPSGKHTIDRVVKPNGSPKILLTIPDVPNGDYAIAIFQDINENGKFDRNFIGIPKEPYAFSQNFHPKMSAPRFDQCKVTISPANSSFVLILSN